MSTPMAPLRTFGCWKSVFREVSRSSSSRRCISSLRTMPAEPKLYAPKDLPECFWSRLPPRLRPDQVKKKLKVYPAPPSAKTACKDPVAVVAEAQIATLDPTGVRKTLFSRKNPEAAKVGDILLVKFKTGDPYSGVCLNIRHRGVDTSILLRNQLTRVGVEMWVKIFSPNVQGIEVVQRREKRARRARLYYMRKPEHDMGSVQNIVHQYIRQKQATGSGGDRRNRAVRVGTKYQGKR